LGARVAEEEDIKTGRVQGGEKILLFARLENSRRALRFDVVKRAIILGLVIFAHDARAQTPLTAAQVMARVQASYASGAIAADFTQRYTAVAYNTTKTSKGRVVIASGGRTDWEYTVPPNNRVVSNASGVCAYEAANNAVYRQSTSMSPYGLLPALLTGQMNASLSFTLERLVSWGYVVLARPSSPSPMLRSAALFIDATSFQVRRVLLIDPQSNRNLFELTNIQQNAPLVPRQFLIQLSPNTTFLGPNGQTALPPTCP